MERLSLKTKTAKMVGTLFLICAMALLPSVAGAETVYPGTSDSDGRVMDSRIAAMSDEEYLDYVNSWRFNAGEPLPDGFSYYILNLTNHTTSYGEDGSIGVDLNGEEFEVIPFSNTYDTSTYWSGYLRPFSDNMSDYQADPEGTFLKMYTDPAGNQYVEYIVQRLTNISNPDDPNFYIAFVFPDNGIAYWQTSDCQKMDSTVEIVLANSDRFGDYNFEQVSKVTNWWSDFNSYFITDERRAGDPVVLVYVDSAVQRPIPQTEEDSA